MSNENTPVETTGADARPTVAEAFNVAAAAEQQPQGEQQMSVAEVVKTSTTPQPAAPATPAPAKAEPPKVKPVVQVNQRPKGRSQSAPKRHAPTDAEVQARWRKQLEESGLFEGQILDLLPQYATKHRGFDPNRSWGGTLISMFVRLGNQLKELETFAAADADKIFHDLQAWLIDLPEKFGDGPDEWNTRFQSSADQREAINSYFGIGGALYSIPKDKMGVMAVRRAAWPSRIEGEKKVGGSFGDRFNYLVLALVNLSMVPDLDIWSKVYHGRVVKKPDWVTPDMRCTECGEPVKITPTGAYRCTGLTCPNRFGTTSTDLSGFDGSNVRMGAVSRQKPWERRNDAPRGGGNNGGDRRRNRDDNESRFERSGKPKGKRPPRQHIIDDELDSTPTGGSVTGENPTVFTTTPAKGFGSLADAFAGVNIS